MPLLAGRVAVVTGAAGGIGRATAVRLAQEGAQVFTGDLELRPENAPLLAEGGIVARRCDVRDEAQIAELIGAAVAAGGRLDILVNNAGIGLVKPIPEVSVAEWDAVLDTNFKAAFLAAKHAIGPLRAAGGGSIVNVASNAGLLPRAADPVYSTSKGALVALTRSLALSHAPDRIRVNAVCPGPVEETGMYEADLAAAADPARKRRSLIAASPLAAALDRMISPAEVAEAILYLVSDAAQMVTGTMLAIDGGKSLGVPPGWGPPV